jgi:hypothetical protein
MKSNPNAIATVMQHLSKVANKQLHGCDDNENASLTTTGARPKQYKTKAIAVMPPTFKGTPDEWTRLTNKQRYRVLNAVKIKAYGLKWRTTNSHYGLQWRTANKQTISNKTSSPTYKKQYKRPDTKYNRFVSGVRKILSSARPATKARIRAYRKKPVNRDRVRAREKSRRNRVQYIEKEHVVSFLREHPDVPVKSAKMTDADAYMQVQELLDSHNPTILQALGMTLRNAFEGGGKPHSSLYVYLSRGSGLERRPGQRYTESERFLLSDPNPVLTTLDGSHYRVSTPAYEALELRSIALCSYDTISAASKVEAALQHFLDARSYGCEKLWKVAGVGKIHATFRRCDINNMINTGNYRPEFSVGITWIENVRWRSTSADNVLTTITCGSNGQISKINRPTRWIKTWKRDQEMFSNECLS